MRTHLRTLVFVGSALLLLFLTSACGGGETPSPPGPVPSPTPYPRPEDPTVEMGLNGANGGKEGADWGDEDRELAVNSGSRWDRLAFWWHVIQPEPGTWNLEAFETPYNNEPLQKILGVLTSQPNTAPWHDDDILHAPVDVDWDCAADYIKTELGQDGRRNGYCVFFNGLEQNAFENGQINPDNQWAHYVYRVTKRYGGKVAAWQIYNEDEFVIETDFNYLNPEGDRLDEPISYYPDPDQLLEAVVVARDVIQVTDPEADVVTPGPEECYMWVIVKEVLGRDLGLGGLEGAEPWQQDWYRELFLI